MKTLILLFGILIATAIGGCRDEQLTNPTAASGKVIVRNGTSFGMCAGYCLRSLQIDSTNLLYIKRSWGRGGGGLPDSLFADTIPHNQWLALQQAVANEYAAFAKLDTIIGCPDCADGGAEWIEIEQKGTVRRVTFEYGAELPEIKTLLGAVRDIRQKFEK
ncbi:MAG: hypothetical protein IT211_03640 [Armatimonadetes bacterium]|nr:hypothetical protein [Armatimonadota bacterium]